MSYSLIRLLFIITALAAGNVSAQQFPNKPIHIITGETGGGLDVAARLMAPGLQASLGYPIVIEYRGFALAPVIVARARPDGYTLLFYGSNFWLAPFMHDDLQYDPVKDFAPVTLVSTAPTVLVVHPSLPVDSVKGLIALAKAKPGLLDYSASPGSPSHLAGELFKSMAGVNIVTIPYKGAGQALTGVLGGEVPLTFAAAASVRPQLKSGKLKAIAVTSPQSSVLFPDLPAVSSALPGYELVSNLGIFAPAGTPQAIINLLFQEIVQVLKRPDVKERFFNAGADAVGSTPQQLEKLMKSEMVVLGKVIKDAGIRGQ